MEPNLFERNLQEIIPKTFNFPKDRPTKGYWGTAPTSEIHIGYFKPILKIADLINSGCEMTILLADLHAVLDNLKSSFELVEHRVVIYKATICAMLKLLNVDISKINFVLGSDFQLTKAYTIDVYKAHTLISVNDAKHAGAEVVKSSDNPKITGLMYPTLQALDEHYLGVDFSLGGIDQRKIEVHSDHILPKLGYKPIVHLFNPLVSGLRFVKKDPNVVVKMSASDVDAKITLTCSNNMLKKKINKVYCLEKDVEDNSLLDLLEHIVFPILTIQNKEFVINRKEKFGGVLKYENFEQIRADFANGLLHPGDFKLGMIDNLNEIISPIRAEFELPEMKKLMKLAEYF